MADRAGSLIGIRANAGPLLIKVTRAAFDPEIKFNRAVTTDASQAARTIVTQYGGILKCTGYVDPSNTANAFLLGSVGAPANANQALTSVEYLIDVSETAASRHGFSCGSCTLVVSGVSGQSDEAGMQEIEFEIHTNSGSAYASNLT